MNKKSFVSPNTLKSKGILSSLLSFVPGTLLCIIFMALLNPLSAYCADKLIVEDASGNIRFAAGDDGTITLNSSTGPVIYGSSATNTELLLTSYATPATGAATLGGGGIFGFARGTQATPAAVQNGDRLGFFLFSGYDGKNPLNTAGMTVKVDGVVSTLNVPSKIAFESDAAGYPRLERMVIASSGYVGIGGDMGNGIPAPGYPLVMASGAYVTTGGVWTDASSRELKENIKDLTGEEAIRTLEGLNPVKYNYKIDKEDRHVGFIAEEVPELLAAKDRKGLSPMDIVAVLTRIVQEQRKAISELAEKVDTLQREMSKVKGMN